MSRSTLTQTFGRFSLSKRISNKLSQSRPRLIRAPVRGTCLIDIGTEGHGETAAFLHDLISWLPTTLCSYRQTIQRNDQSARGRAPLAQQSYCTSAIG